MANDDWAATVLAAVTKLAQSPSLTWEQASTYALLPTATTCAGATWLVLQGTGVWPTSKPSGWYYSDGASWSYLGSYNPIVSGGNVVVTNFPSVQAVSGPLTDAQLRATPVPISGDLALSGSINVGNFPAVQPISGSVSVANFPATQPVSGTFWQVTQPISAATLPLPSGASTEATLALIKAKTDNLDVALSTRTKPADTQVISGAVSVSNLPATQPVSGPLTDTQLRASAVPVSGAFYQATQPVSGTFWQATQPISGSVSVSNFPATQPVSGPLTDTQLRVSAVPVSGTFFQATQPVSGAVTVTPPSRIYVSFTANAAAGVTSEALLSFTQNKQGTNTSSVTSYTVTSGKTLRITSISIGLKSAAAAIAFAKIILRHNTAGATTASSPIAYLCPEINTNSATSGTGAWITIPIPDGLEFVGNGTQTIGVSHLDQAATNVLNVTVYGFEY